MENENKCTSTVSIDYELFAGFKIGKNDFAELEEQIQKICETHDGRHLVHITVRNWYGRDNN